MMPVSPSNLRVLSTAATVWLWLFCAQTVNAQETNFIRLSSGSPPPLTNVNLAVSNAGLGSSASGLPPGIENFSVSADLGDLSTVTNGAPAQVIVGMRVRGDVPYNLVMSALSFTVNNLAYRGRDLSGAQDRGSFIRITAGTPAAAGPRSNPQGTNINGAFAGQGILLSQVFGGRVNAASSNIVATGQAPTRQVEEPPTPRVGGPAPPTTGAMMGGTMTGAPDGTGTMAGGMTGTGTTNGIMTGGTTPSGAATAGGAPTVPPGRRPDRDDQSGVDIPVYFWFPTGLALGPVQSSTPGTFTAVLEFGVFPRP